MKLSNGNKEVLEALMEHGGYITGNDLSIKLGVTQKTIYRRIKSLRELLGEDIVESHPNKGYRLNYEGYLINITKYTGNNNKEMSVDTRRLSILLHLLVTSPKPTSIATLAQKYYVSESSIVADLNIIEKDIEKLELKVNRTNKGTYIFGKEKIIRKELMKIFNDILSDSAELYSFDGFQLSSVKKMESVIDRTLKKYSFNLENPYYINLLTHLLILLKRGENKDELSTYEVVEETNNYNKGIHDVAKYIVSEIERDFDIKINDVEVSYIYLYLVSARRCKEDFILEEIYTLHLQDNNELDKFVSEMVMEMGKKLNLNFSNDDHLKKVLLLHMKQMFNRINYNIIIVNPLIKQIKEEFPNTFYTLKKIILKLKEKYKMNNISDEEIGYIAIYFQNSIEKINERVNVLIVCSTGIGTSHLLKTRINNNFPLLNIKGMVSANEITNYEVEDVDFILTTVNLPEVSVPVLLISALLNKKDVNVINQFIKNYKELI